MRVVALVPAAGRGVRLGAGLPKALVAVGGVPLLVRAVRGLLGSGSVDHVVIAVGEPELSRVHEVLLSFDVPIELVTVVAGGTDRTASVRLALAAALSGPIAVDAVLVHDAARAFTPPAMVAAVVAAVRSGAAAVIPVLPVADTIKQVTAEHRVVTTVDRSALRIVQTPQGFSTEVLRRAYELEVPATDDSGLAEQLGVAVHTVPGHPYAMKITTPFDLAVAEAVLAAEPSTLML
ncbi:MAG: 2-C-methyl-D-erythritol 4-phosphate cytidylyltransferase [Sciscionella sp.]